MYSTAVLKIDDASKIRANWLKISRNSAIFGQNSANFRQFTHINFNLFHYAGNNPVKYVDPTGAYSDDEICSFKKMNSKQQMSFLKSEYESVAQGTPSEKGAKAAEMRELRDIMKLSGLFKLDENFMNGELRDFLNMKEDGTDYTYEEVSGKLGEQNGWTELCSIGSQYHQSNAGDKNHLNAKFVNKDGREVVFNSDKIIQKDYPDKGTFNYADGTPFSSILFGSHKLYDMNTYDNLMSNLGFSPVKKYNGIFSGGAWYGNSHYWSK